MISSGVFLCKRGDINKAVHIVDEMVIHGCVLDEGTWNAVVGTILELNESVGSFWVVAGRADKQISYAWMINLKLIFMSQLSDLDLWIFYSL